MLPQPGEVYVKVTAAKDFEIRRGDQAQDYIEDRFDGVPFVFKAGHSITLPPDAARHIFGCVAGQSSMKDMFNHFSKRAGWNTPEMAPRAKDLWGKLKFEPVVMQLVEQPLKELAKDEAA